MKFKINFSSKEDMQTKAKHVEEDNKKDGTTFRMVSSDFDNPNWKQGDPQVGVMTFTDEPEPIVVQPLRIEERVEALEKKAGIAR